ncbi:hypothetical protein LZ31DRAFT_251358 [Colletotrichum somersetense]|nr:hypothetical protein LZ31DRAFT_251358 [Colletotrichum somersetense]
MPGQPMWRHAHRASLPSIPLLTLGCVHDGIRYDDISVDRDARFAMAMPCICSFPFPTSRYCPVSCPTPGGNVAALCQVALGRTSVVVVFPWAHALKHVFTQGIMRVTLNPFVGGPLQSVSSSQDSRFEAEQEIDKDFFSWSGPWSR